MRREAFLAIFFVGGLLNSQLPAISKNQGEIGDSVVHGIAGNTKLDPAMRAFYLLKLANSYLEKGKSAADEQYGPLVNQAPGGGFWRWQTQLVDWAEQVVHSGAPTEPIDRKTKPHHTSKENVALANEAITEALAQLDTGGNKFATMNLYFIASRLLRKADNEDTAQRYEDNLERVFQSCERKSPIDEQEIGAASSVLNLMAYAFIPVAIPEWAGSPSKQATQVKAFTEEDYKESQKLKLRAVALADRLPASSDVRRRAHRDLALWYMQLGKRDLAEEQKKILFKLIGSSDQRLLYPTSVFCGHAIWWEVNSAKRKDFCGMG